MIKEMKKIISSPFFTLIFILSIVLLLVNYFVYQNGDFNYQPRYEITYSENIEEYDERINYYNDLIDSMDEKMYRYDYFKNKYLDTIKIYEQLKLNNNDYSIIYDFGFGNVNDRGVYLYSSNSFMLLIIVLNVLTVLYLAFTRDFDNSKYMFIYSGKRSRVVLNKILSSFCILNLSFLIYFVINVIFSMKFEAKYQLFLVSGKEINMLKTNYYVFCNIFLHLLYNLWFLFVVFWTIAICMKKTLVYLIFIMIFGLFISIIPISNNIFTFIGLSLSYNLIPFEVINYAKIFILIPIGLLLASLFYFEKRDL